jgi:hypothetical protein
MVAEFKTIPDRDAYAVIRGFRYQVQLTVRAWVQLPDDELLELEAGEDIDWVKLVNKPRAEVERLLGQAKFRTRPLRLRSPEAVMSVFHFYKHRQNNPGAKLRFRYITNAALTSDKRTVHPSGLSAVELWEALRIGQGEEAEQSDAIEFIRLQIVSTTKPIKVESGEWRDFKKFVESAHPEALLEFIERFEWALGNSDPKDQSAEIKALLQTRDEVNSSVAAEVALEHLSNLVIEKLSTRDLKQLTAPECHNALIACKTMAQDATCLGLSSLVERFERTATRMELTFEQVERAGAVGLAQFGTEATEIRFGAPDLLVESPALVEPHACRAVLVSVLENSLRTGNWVALVGDSGIGKSQLVRLVRERFSECLWLNLRDMPGPKQGPAIEQVLRLISKTRVPYRSRDWYLSAVSSLPPASLIVLDDLEAGSGGLFTSRLALLARACKKHGRFLISASALPPPSYLSEALRDVLEVKCVPTYTDEDLRELLKKHGAPDGLVVDHFINMIHTVTRRHPQLVSALIRFMQRRKWRYNIDTVVPLLDGSYADDLRLQIQRTLTQTTTGDVRQLLYRLNIIGPRFTEREAAEVARINPAVRGVTEKLAELAGVWVQVLGQQQYSVSPLVTQLGSNNLAESVKRATHVYAAGAIICKKSLNQVDALSAITHLVQAKSFNRAAILLLQALNSLLYAEETVEDGGLLLVWMNMPLPQEMKFELRLFLRGVQTAAAGRYGLDYSKSLEDLEVLLEMSTPRHALGVFIASSTAAIHLARSDPKRAGKLLLRAMGAKPHLPAAAIPIVDAAPSLVGLFWLLATGMKTADEVAQWFSTVEQLPNEQQKQLWNALNGPEGALVMLDGLWGSEQKKPATEQNWGLLLDRIREFATRADAMGGQILWAFCRRAELAIQIVHLQQFNEAEVLLSQTLALIHNDPALVFIIAEGAGVWWADVERWDLASHFLARAVHTNCRRFPSMYLRALLSRAWAESKQGRTDPDALTSAVTFAREDATIGELDLIVALSEQAVSLWTHDDRRGAFILWEEVVERLLSHSEHSTPWMQLYALIANNSSFFGTVTKDGGVSPNVFTPESGMFLRQWPNLSTMYSESTMWMLPGAMTWFADALGEVTKAGTWALKTVEIAESVSSDPTRRFFLLYAVPTAIREGRYIDAIQYALDATVSTTRPPPTQVTQALNTIDLRSSEVERSRPTREPKRAELEAAQLALLPAYLDIIRVWHTNEIAGANAADSVIEKCEAIAETACDPELWKRAAVVIRQVFQRRISEEQISAEASKYVGEHGSFHLILLYFGSGIGSSPEYAFRAQMASVAWVQGCFQNFTALSNQVVARAVNSSWQSVIEKEGYRFQRPRDALILLREAAGSDSLRETLRIVAQSLGASLSERDRSWLYS